MLGQISVSMSTPTAGGSAGSAAPRPACRRAARPAHRRARSRPGRPHAGRRAAGQQQAHVGQLARSAWISGRRPASRRATRRAPTTAPGAAARVVAQALAERLAYSGSFAAPLEAQPVHRREQAQQQRIARRARTEGAGHAAHGEPSPISARRRRCRRPPDALPRRPRRRDSRHRIAFDRDLQAAAVRAAAARFATRSGSCRAGRAAGRALSRCGSARCRRRSRPPAVARRSMNVPSSSAGHTVAVAADRRGDRARALAFFAAGLRQRERASPGRQRRPSSIQLASGQSLSARERAVDRARIVRGAPASAGAARARARTTGGASMRVPSAAATSSRDRSSAWLCGSTRIAFDTSQRAGASWLAPSVRLARPKLVPRASRAITADLVRPCRSTIAS